MLSSIFSRLVILVFGTLYPAYASYKAIKTKNVKEYVKWMMYWIVFALFTCAETVTDIFLAFWFPFYYEIKIMLVLWLLSPATRGSSILYRKFVHPWLSSREQDIDIYINQAREQGYHTIVQMGTRGINYASNIIMQTAIRSVLIVKNNNNDKIQAVTAAAFVTPPVEGSTTQHVTGLPDSAQSSMDELLRDVSGDSECTTEEEEREENGMREKKKIKYRRSRRIALKEAA